MGNGKIYAALVIALFILAACKTAQPAKNNTSISGEIIDIGTKTGITKEKPIETTPTKPAETKPTGTKPTAPSKPAKTELAVPDKYKDITIRKTVTEGDLVQLRPEAVDYDNDTITYTFSKPLDAKGRWQTKVGDEGFYPVDITASDGKATTTEKVLIIVNPTNRPPELTCPKEINANEGDTVSIDCTATDREGEDILIEYSGWMTQKTKTAGFDDAGTHTVTVTASDANGKTTATVKIIVANTNRPPVITGLQDLSVTEGDFVKLVPIVNDPDGDKVTVSFSKPLDESGQWKTAKGNAGNYNLTVFAKDGDMTSTKMVKLTVKRQNLPPVLQKIPDVTISEGDMVTLSPKATDPEGDKVIITITGWMDSLTKTTTYGDAGTYSVKVIASDGFLETSQDVKVTVLKKNRPPVFRVPI